MNGLDSNIAMKDAHIGSPDLPDQYDQDERGEEAPPPASLVEDVIGLFEDGKTYAQAELAYQKSRAGFVAEQSKYVLAYGAGALGVLHLALIGLTVGVLIALIPLVGPWFATLIVTLALLVLGVVLVRKLRGRIVAIRSAFAENGK